MKMNNMLFILKKIVTYMSHIEANNKCVRCE